MSQSDREAADGRPPVWVGHVTLPSPEIPETYEFLVRLGLRPITVGDDFGVLELRGGTHLVLLRSEQEAGLAGFDLMVEDIDATERELRERGIETTKMERGKIHSSFLIKTPAGHTIKFNSTHVSDQPV
jgi:catechol 2,3-dioxygenase-like lactoylglutathione lyase family enzyme